MVVDRIVRTVNLSGTGRKLIAARNAFYKNRIMFIHVPKSGGTSLSHGLRLRYAFSHFKLSEEASREACPGPSIQEWMHIKRQIAAYHAECGAHYVQAHMPVDRAFLDHFADRYRLITLLRDPLDRLVSHYFFDPRLRSMEPMAFLESRRGYIETHVLGHFFGEMNWDEPSSEAAGRDRAIENLSRFSVIGFLDRPDAFYRDLADRVGIRLVMPRRNVGTERPKAELPAAFYERARELCAHDLEIYEHVSNQLDRGTAPGQSPLEPAPP